MQHRHKTVLPIAAIDALALSPDSSVVDATLGSGGHTQAILDRLGPRGRLFSLDIDPDAIEIAKKTLPETPLLTLRVGDFRHLEEYVAANEADAVLADLGWRSEQFAASGRGFSFQVDEPLCMTFGDPAQYPFTATDIVNDWSTESLINILKGYGEERYAKRIVRAIDEARAVSPITTTVQLANIVTKAVPAYVRHGRIHPATKTFQALRITVNDELGALEDFLRAAWKVLKNNGRLAIITFHSLEDRLVKHHFRSLADAGVAKLPHKKPIIAEETERNTNPRSRSAKLRTIIKLPNDTL